MSINTVPLIKYIKQITNGYFNHLVYNISKILRGKIN